MPEARDTGADQISKLTARRGPAQIVVPVSPGEDSGDFHKRGLGPRLVLFQFPVSHPSSIKALQQYDVPVYNTLDTEF